MLGARPGGAFMKNATIPHTPRVLFVCEQDTGNSKMAAAFLRHYSGNRVEATSAGKNPAERVDPATITAMAEVGIDIQHALPTKLTPDITQEADLIITIGKMSGGDSATGPRGTYAISWNIPDKKDDSLSTVRRARDDIEQRVQDLLNELLAETE